MTDATADFFQGLSQRGYERGLANMTGTVRFVINQRGHTDEWCLRIDKGDLRVSAGSRRRGLRGSRLRDRRSQGRVRRRCDR